MSVCRWCGQELHYSAAWSEWALLDPREVIYDDGHWEFRCGSAPPIDRLAELQPTRRRFWRYAGPHDPVTQVTGLSGN